MKKKNSVLSKDKPTDTLPERTMSIHTKELLEKSEKARKKLTEYKARME